MYVARIPNRNSPPAYLIREGYRDDGKVKTRTIANITKLGGDKIEMIRRVLKGETLVPAEEAVENHHRSRIMDIPAGLPIAHGTGGGMGIFQPLFLGFHRRLETFH
jgi:hypothetical protein